MTQETIASIRVRAELARRLSNENKQADAKEALLQIASMLEADADRLEAAAQQEPGRAIAMNDCRSRNFGLALLCIAAAPLLLFASAVTVLTSRIANAIFGHDPAASLLERHREALTILTLTGRCTLGLLAAGLLFRGAI